MYIHVESDVQHVRGSDDFRSVPHAARYANRAASLKQGYVGRFNVLKCNCTSHERQWTNSHPLRCISSSDEKSTLICE